MNDDQLEQNPLRQFYAYRLKAGGHIHVRRYSEMAMDEVETSTFVDEVFGPYDALNRAAAEKIAVSQLSVKQ